MTSKSPRQIFIEITHELNEILEEVIVHTASKPKFNIDLTKGSKDVTIDIMHARKFGRCYSWITPWVLAMSGVSLLVGKQEFLRVVHHFFFPLAFRHARCKSS